MEQTFDNTETYNPNEYQLILNQMEEFLSSVSSLDSISCDFNIKILELIFTQNNKKEKITFFLDLQKLLKRKSKLSAQNLDKLLKDYVLKLPRNVIEDEKRFNEHIFMKFLNGKLILLTDFDEIFVGLLTKNNSINLQNTIIKLLTSLILEQHVLNPQNLAIIPLLQNILENRENVARDLPAFFEELKKERYNTFVNPNLNFQLNKKENLANVDVQNYINAVTHIFGEYDKQFYEIVVEKFEKWLLLSTENQITAYIHDLESSFVSKLDENFKKFFVYVIDICINRALDSL